MTVKNKLYVFAGGASGGHLYPGIAVAQILQEFDPAAEVMFLCTQRQIDKDILKNFSWRYLPQSVVPLPSKVIRIGDFWRRWRSSVRMCKRLMENEKPLAVLGLGGFASGPALKAASKLKIPAGILNPDAIPGKANRFCLKYADKIFLQWEMNRRYFGRNVGKCLVTGCPVRPEIIKKRGTDEKTDIEKPRVRNEQNQTEARQELGLDGWIKTLVVMGGSQGGHNVNGASVQCLAGKLVNIEGWQVLHLTGKIDEPSVRRAYKTANVPGKVLAFSEQMESVLAAADLVISRAGASSLAELTAMGLPSILLPYPYHKDRHQLHNAEMLAKAAAARIVIDDGDIPGTADRLAKVMTECMQEGIWQSMSWSARTIGKPGAAWTVATELARLTES